MSQNQMHLPIGEPQRAGRITTEACRLSRVLLAGAVLAGTALVVQAEDLPGLFQRVSTSVVVVRAKGRDLTVQSGASVLVKYKEVGSGALVSVDGKVLTAAHVVQIADEITVEFVGGESVAATVIASEVKADVALLQLSRVPAGISPAPLGDSSTVRVGEQVFIVGAPYGIAHTLTVGHVSGRHKPNTIYAEVPLAEFIQTDAAINQGNAGGPMFTCGERSSASSATSSRSRAVTKASGRRDLEYGVTAPA